MILHVSKERRMIITLFLIQKGGPHRILKHKNCGFCLFMFLWRGNDYYACL